MPPKQSTASSRGRGSSSTAGRPSKSNAAAAPKAKASGASRVRNQPPPSYSDSHQVISDLSDLDPFAEDEPPQKKQQQRRRNGGQDTTMDIDETERAVDDEDEDEDEDRKTIPPELLTHVLQQFFEKDGTRVAKDANAAVAKYMDIFVREAIARTVVEKEKGFLEVEDLEKVAPQLLLDL